jgi:hypothetical protein
VSCHHHIACPPRAAVRAPHGPPTTPRRRTAHHEIGPWSVHGLHPCLRSSQPSLAALQAFTEGERRDSNPRPPGPQPTPGVASSVAQAGKRRYAARSST